MLKLNCSQTVGGISRVVLSLAIAVSVCTVIAQPAHALNCGDVITADVTLTSDLGPCSGNGISMDGIPTHVTVNLNGYAIRGKGTGNGITIGAAFPGVTIKGPGKIANFAMGILAGGAAPDLMVYDVTLTGNQNAIGLSGAGNASIRILNNVIQSAGKGATAISAGNEGNVYIYQNVINGFSTAAVSVLGETTVSIDENLIALNQVGVITDTFETCTNIRGNTITLNRGDGIEMGSDPSAMKKQAKPELASTASCNDIEDNTVSYNGGNGIFVEGGESQPLVQNNIVTSNGANGISIAGGDTGSIYIMGNRVSGSVGSDFLWDGNGTPCWKQNIFTTSSPATLPPCS